MPFVVGSRPRLDPGSLSPFRRKDPLPLPFDSKSAYYFPLARRGIYHGLRVIGASPGDTILVPSFHCSSVVDPVLLYGAHVKFFNIRRDASPDFGDLEAKIDGKVRAVLVIHYFGFPQPIHKLMDLCRAYRLSLIEDCAHILAGEVDGTVLGTVGESVFSAGGSFCPSSTAGSWSSTTLNFMLIFRGKDISHWPLWKWWEKSSMISSVVPPSRR
jgi:perosamine synthetase